MGETVITDMVHHKLLKTVWISNRHSYAVGGNLTTNDVFRHLTVFTPAEWKRCCGLEIKSKQSEPHPLKSFTTLNFSFLFFFFFFVRGSELQFLYSLPHPYSPGSPWGSWASSGPQLVVNVLPDRMPDEKGLGPGH